MAARTTPPDFGTDDGPACDRCGGTVYEYRLDDDGIRARCTGCHFHCWYQAGPEDTRPTTAAEARALHETAVTRVRRWEEEKCT